MSVYELAILGNASAVNRQTLASTLGQMIDAFGLKIGADVILHDGTSVLDRDKHAAFAATYFGAANHLDVDVALALSKASAPIIPTIAAAGNFGTDIPLALQPSNGLRRRDDDPNMRELAVALLECVGLLRRQRRVFVSYRRIESRSAAMQLHDLMTARGFDVFLDTHDVRPGDAFQDVLWHRLCDSDVVVMLDTPTYFDSKWTRQEIGRARAKEIHVLRIVWPEHVPNKLTDMAETIYLTVGELVHADGPLIEVTADQIILAVESLRSRSIASRYMSITGRLRAEAERIGARVEGVGAHRAISLRLLNERKVWAYPIVGLPSAELLNEIADKAKRCDQQEAPILVYDHVGIRDGWAAHLKWLDDNIKTVRALKVAEAGWALAAWEE